MPWNLPNFFTIYLSVGALFLLGKLLKNSGLTWQRMPSK